MSESVCESCGQPATVTLPDGSTWCARCDASARSLGYDNGQPLNERCTDADMRVERIVHLDTMVASALDLDLAEWLAEHGETILADRFGVRVPWDESGGYIDREAFEETLAWSRVSGWLVQIATPSRDRWPMVSWGSYLTHLFYGKSYEEALAAGFEWVASLPKGAS